MSRDDGGHETGAEPRAEGRAENREEGRAARPDERPHGSHQDGHHEGGASGQAGEPAAAALPGARTPQGTMFVVLVYGAAAVVLWFYMYYIVLKSEGFLGGF